MVGGKKDWREQLVAEYRGTYRMLTAAGERAGAQGDLVADLEYIGAMQRDTVWIMGKIRQGARRYKAEELGFLTVRQRTIFLANQGGLSHSEIADMFRLTRGTVERHLLRAREKMQRAKVTKLDSG